jgi:hypothetical protein
MQANMHNSPTNHEQHDFNNEQDQANARSNPAGAETMPVQGRPRNMLRRIRRTLSGEAAKVGNL